MCLILFCSQPTSDSFRSLPRTHSWFFLLSTYSFLRETVYPPLILSSSPFTHCLTVHPLLNLSNGLFIPGFVQRSIHYWMNLSYGPPTLISFHPHQVLHTLFSLSALLGGEYLPLGLELCRQILSCRCFALVFYVSLFLWVFCVAWEREWCWWNLKWGLRQKWLEQKWVETEVTRVGYYSLGNYHSKV